MYVDPRRDAIFVCLQTQQKQSLSPKKQQQRNTNNTMADESAESAGNTGQVMITVDDVDPGATGKVYNLVLGVFELPWEFAISKTYVESLVAQHGYHRLSGENEWMNLASKYTRLVKQAKSYFTDKIKMMMLERANEIDIQNKDGSRLQSFDAFKACCALDASAAFASKVKEVTFDQFARRKH